MSEEHPLLLSALHACNEAHWPEAEQTLRDYWQTIPDPAKRTAISYAKMTLTLRSQQRVDEAIAIANEGLEYHPDNSAIIEELVHIHMKFGQWDNAIALLEIIADKTKQTRQKRTVELLTCYANAGHIKALRTYAAAHIKKYDMPRVKDTLEQIDTIKARCKQALHIRGLIKAGKLAEAKTALYALFSGEELYQGRLLSRQLIGLPEEILLARAGGAKRRGRRAMTDMATAIDHIIEANPFSYVPLDKQDITPHIELLAEALLCKAIPPEALRWESWLVLNNLCVGHFYFAAGNVARNQSIAFLQCRYEKNALSEAETKRLAYAAIEKRDFTLANTLVTQLENAADKPTIWMLRLRTYLEALKIGKPHNLAMTKTARQEWATFKSLLAGKNLAVLGAARSDVAQGKEIDGYDLILRTNYRNREVPQDPTTYGSRTDISYYNHGDPTSFRREVLTVMPELTYGVFKDAGDTKEFAKHVTSRKMQRHPFMFKGSTNGIQNILYEVMHCKATSIKIFCANFFLSANPYTEGYRKGHNLSGRNWVVHDAVSNFLFVRNLWQSGLVIADADCERVLKLTGDEYMEQLDLLYCPQHVGKEPSVAIATQAPTDTLSSPYATISYAQQGEDLVLERILTRIFKLKNYRGFYVDVGAHHPEHKSNTKRLYDAGYRGINLDVQKAAIDLFNQKRPEDINLHCGVSDTDGRIVSYIDPKTLSGTATCDAETATKFKERGKRIEEVVVPARRLSAILDEHAAGRKVDYLNIDVEGFEMQVLKGMDFARHRPRIISIEIHAKSVSEALQSDVAHHLEAQGYYCVGSTVITYFFIGK